MRLAAVAIACLAGCPDPPPDGQACDTDSQCGSDICARDGECIAASQVRMVKLTWTVRGLMANATTCASQPDLELNFYGPDVNDVFGFEPVPCMQGQFTIDRIPDRFDQAELRTPSGISQFATIDATGVVAFDLQL
jgi:hypothetical protein